MCYYEYINKKARTNDMNDINDNVNSFCNAIWNECDELREGANETLSDDEIADAIEQCDALANALYNDEIDFDATWQDVFEDCTIDVVFEGQHNECIVIAIDENSATICDVRTFNVYTYERGVDGWYEINNAQERYEFVRVATSYVEHLRGGEKI